jgi:hypothetical protein
MRHEIGQRDQEAARSPQQQEHDTFQWGPGVTKLLQLLSDPQPSPHEIARHMESLGGREWNQMVEVLQRRMGNGFTQQVMAETQTYQRAKTPDGW